MTLYEKSAAEEMSQLQKMFCARSANPRPATVLFKGGVQKVEQGVAAKAVAGEAGKSKLLVRGERSGARPPMAKGKSGVLAE